MKCFILLLFNKKRFLIKRFADCPEDAIKQIDQVKRKRSKSMPKLNELMLSTELNLNVDEIIKDRFKTTDLIQIKFSFKFKVFLLKTLNRGRRLNG